MANQHFPKGPCVVPVWGQGWEPDSSPWGCGPRAICPQAGTQQSALRTGAVTQLGRQPPTAPNFGVLPACSGSITKAFVITSFNLCLQQGSPCLLLSEVFTLETITAVRDSHRSPPPCKGVSCSALAMQTVIRWIKDKPCLGGFTVERTQRSCRW